MTLKSQDRWVTLNELICELAYGRRMNYAEMVAYESDNNCVPANSKGRGWLEFGLRDLSGGINVYAGGVTYVDPEYDERADERRYEALRSPTYCEARDFILGHAEAGKICIYARSPKERHDDSSPIPIAAIYRPIPENVFIAEHLFAPDDPPVLWPKEGCSSQDAEWYYPMLKAADATTLASERQSVGTTTVNTEVGASPRPRGPRPDTRNRIIKQMRLDVAAGYNLAGATEEELSTKYGASRDTCRIARRTALSQSTE
jgi:hypothetical protein